MRLDHVSVSLRPLCEGDVAMLVSSTADDTEALTRLGGMSYAVWWQLVRDDPDRYGWIAHEYGRAVGYLDAERDGHEVWVAVMVFAPFRGRGLAGQILRACLTREPFCSAEVLAGAIEADNEASLRLAASSGLVGSGIDDDGLMIWTRKMDAPQR